MGKWSPRLVGDIVFAILLTLSAGSISWLWLRSTPTHQAQPSEEDPEMFETTWKDANGLTHKVSTEQLPGESVGDWADRHKEAVDALMAIYPAVK